MDSLMGSEAAIPTKALACMLAIPGIFLTTHSSSRLNDSCTFSRYLVMRSSLASYSFRMCPTTSWGSFWILTLEMERAIARLRSDIMTLYFVSLFDVGNSKQIDCSSCFLVGDSRRRPTLDLDDRETPSTWKIHHPDLTLHGQSRLIFNFVLA